MKVTAKVVGIKEAKAQLAKLPPQALVAAERGLYQIAQQGLRLAQEDCPVETGALRSTGHVQQPVVKGKAINVTVGFGGPAAPYAIWVHERLDAHHPVGHAKFLESGIGRAAHSGTQLLADLMAKAGMP